VEQNVSLVVHGTDEAKHQTLFVVQGGGWLGQNEKPEASRGGGSRWKPPFVLLSCLFGETESHTRTLLLTPFYYYLLTRQQDNKTGACKSFTHQAFGCLAPRGHHQDSQDNQAMEG
jgi:hypothetical protein